MLRRSPADGHDAPPGSVSAVPVRVLTRIAGESAQLRALRRLSELGVADGVSGCVALMVGDADVAGFDRSVAPVAAESGGDAVGLVDVEGVGERRRGVSGSAEQGERVGRVDDQRRGGGRDSSFRDSTGALALCRVAELRHRWALSNGKLIGHDAITDCGLRQVIATRNGPDQGRGRCGDDESLPLDRRNGTSR